MSDQPETIPGEMPAALRLLNKERQAALTPPAPEPAVVPEVVTTLPASPTEPVVESPLLEVQRTYGAVLTDPQVVKAVTKVLTNAKAPKELKDMFQAIGQLVLADVPTGPRVSVRLVSRVGRSA